MKRAENWKKVGTKYMVSDRGRVFSIKRGKVMQQFTSGGYGGSTYKYLFLFPDNGGRKKKVYVHRLVAEYFCPRPPGCDEVHHKNDNSCFNFAINLQWVTREENMFHRWNKTGYNWPPPFVCVCNESPVDTVKYVKIAPYKQQNPL